MILADFRQVQEKRDKKHDENRTNPNPNKQPHTFAHTATPHIASQTLMNTSQASSLARSGKYNKQQHSKRQEQSTVLDYISELGIGNVEEFFMCEDEKRRREQRERDDGEKERRLVESVQRLYETGVGFGKKVAGKGVDAGTREGQHSEEDDNHPSSPSSSSPPPYYTSLYPLSPDFTHHFLTRRLQTSCQKFRQKLWSKFLTKYEIWVASDAEDRVRKELLRSTLKRGDVRSRYGVRVEREVREGFVRAVVGLVMREGLDSKGKSDKGKSDNEKSGGDVISSEDSFFARYCDYLNQHKLKHFLPPSPPQQPPQQQQFTQHHYDHLKLLAHRLPFVYYFMDFQHLQRAQDVQFKEMKDLERWVIERYGTKRDWERMYGVFEGSVEVRVTVPFQTKLYQVKKRQGDIDNDKGERGLGEEDEDDDDMSYEKFKANPIPPTTYKQPSTRPASSKKPSTQPIPFNFTHPPHPPPPQPTSPNPNLHPAPFKATPIPSTLYQPQLIGTNPQQKQLSKKQHMEKLYHQSKFPKTMGYLENYVEFREGVRRGLEEKLMEGKERGGEEGKVKEIPDFGRLHRRETLMLETRKEMNRVNTQPKPFNFTETSKRSDLRNTLKTTFIIDQELLQQSSKQQKRINTTTHNIPHPKSTAKFAAYTQLRKQQRQQHKQSILQKQQAQKRKQSDMKVYKDILKQRMMNELSSQPRAVQYDYGKVGGNVVRVDLEGIYVGRPLLMEGNKGKGSKGGKLVKDDERTCYTDGFEPII